MTIFSLQEIEIDKLLLDVRNPRHDILTDQTETLREIILDQKFKLINLAQDIVDNGINPSELTIVMASDDNDGKFTVLEGNRRLAALKLLLDPAMAALGSDQRDIDKLKSYSKKFKTSQIDRLSCVVFKQRDDADHWIELKHTGENDGKGVVAWKAKETARFNERIGKPNSALQVLEFVRKNANLAAEDLEVLKKPNLSSIERLINDPDVRGALGINLADGYVTSNLPAEELINGLTKLVMDIATQRKKVDDIRHKTDRTNYMSEFSKEELPDSKITSTETWKLQSQAGQVKPRFSSTTSKSTPSSIKHSVPLSINRKTLIPSSCVLVIKTAPRINKVYRELRDLEIDHFENAGAVMFRVFLELSLEHYAGRNGISFPENEYLVSKLQKVAEHIKKSKIMSDAELKPIRVACSSKDSLFAANTLNAYVHNPDFSPKSTDLKITWDNFEKFFKSIWP